MNNNKVVEFNEVVFSAWRDYDVFYINIEYTTYKGGDFKYTVFKGEDRRAQEEKEFWCAGNAYDYIFKYLRNYMNLDEFKPSMVDECDWMNQCYMTEQKFVDKSIMDSAKFNHGIVVVQSETIKKERKYIPLYVINEITYRQYKKCYKLKLIK